MTKENYVVENLRKFVPTLSVQNRKRKILLVFFGLVIGGINGLLGAGGGMLVVPVLTFVMGLTEKRSHATAITLVLPLCAIGAVVYALRSNYDYSSFPWAILGVVVGGVIGAYLLKKISNVALQFVFYGVMLFAGLKMII